MGSLYVPCSVTPPGTGAGALWAAVPGALGNFQVGGLRYIEELDLFFAVGRANAAGDPFAIATSPNGEVWTLRNSGTTIVAFKGIAYSPSLGRLVAGGSRISGSSDNFISYSDDGGITWTNVAATPDEAQPNAILWDENAGLFVAGIANTAGLPANQRAMTSPDGLVWTMRATPLGAAGIQDLATNGNRIVAGCANGMMYSDNGGVSFTSAGVGAVQFNGVVYSPELALYVGVNSTTAGLRVSTSADGAVWTPRATPANNSWQKIAWGGPAANTFAAISFDGVLNRMMVSPSGIAGWATRTPPDLSYNSIAYSTVLGRFVAVATLSGTMVSVISGT